jgi:hypothetical protein
MIIGLELEAQSIINDAQVAVPAAPHCLWRESLYLLCHDANIGLHPAVIDETVEAEAIVEAADKADVMFKPDIGTASASTAAPKPATGTRKTPVCSAKASVAKAQAAASPSDTSAMEAAAMPQARLPALGPKTRRSAGADVARSFAAPCAACAL